MRIIDADALLEKMIRTNRYFAVKFDIEEMPTIDPESLRPHGRWEKSEDDYCGLALFKCSLCREEWCFEIDEDIELLNYRFCPNCGAKMGLEEEMTIDQD